ncbi:DUF4253 domain-containing protein [Pseudomonas sp. K1(2024)]|uniref:DUF4253 domain-containing protein n=1 Tax=Pseudomonas boreofloridensis TaxID=3064348 RepID=A0ABV4Z2Z3_9PSED|nr:DUF4253 domain-containing protein [Pseudomonas sp. K13]MDO7900592.1 DUF4253 domain-containing protein [Pseudomonas sp. K13]
MIIQFLGNDSAHNPSSRTCDAYRLDGLTRMDELSAAGRKIAARHSGCTVLFSLDDLPQALYTSGHARLSSNLDAVSEADLGQLPPECFENGQYLGYTTTKAEFAPCLRILLRQAQALSFEALCAHGLTLDDAALEHWLAYQAKPLMLIDQPMLALAAPVEQPWQALAAFPNGYFESDLDPAQNCALARHLQQTHGYTLMGVGASYLGFTRAEAPDAAQAARVAADLCALYNVPAEQHEVRLDVLRAGIEGRSHLWVRYVE